MAKLIKHEDLAVAVQVNGEALISVDNGILYEEIGDDEMFLYVKTGDEKTEVKIKISRKNVDN